MATAPISDSVTRNDYTATSGQTTFPYTFWIKDQGHLDVYRNGNLLTITTDYTVSAVQSVTGANVVLTTGSTANDKISIVYDPAIERQTEFATSGSFGAASVNLEYAYLVSLCQYLSTQTDRTFKLSDSTQSSATLTVDAPDNNAGKVLVVNGTGDGFSYGTVASDSQLANFENDSLSGDNSTVTFTLSFTPVSQDALIVSVDGVIQRPGTNFTISSNQITFDTAPSAGADNIFVLNFASSLTAVEAEVGDGDITTAKLANSAVTSVKIADGTIATADLADDVVTSAKLATDSVTADAIAASAVGSAEIASNAVTEAKVADAAITYSKIEDVSAGVILGRGDSGVGSIQELTVGTGLSLSGTTLTATGGGGASYKLEQASISSPPSAPYDNQWGYAAANSGGSSVATQINSGSFTSTPTSYTYMADLAPWRTHYSNHAGYQQFYTSDSGGRTMLPVHYVQGYHDGYGDNNAFAASIGIGRHSDYSSATRWTGYNSVTGFSADCGAVGAGNVNVYGAEFQLRDEGFADVSGLGLVLKLYRNSSTTTVDTLWTGVRVDSEGSAAADAAFQANGDYKVGIDLSGSDISTQVGLVMRQSQRVVFAASQTTAPTEWYYSQNSSVDTEYFTYDGSKFVFVDNAVPSCQISQNTFVFAPESGGVPVSKLQVTSSGVQTSNDFFVQSSIGGSNYFRANSSAVTTSSQLNVSGGVSFSSSGSPTSSSATAGAASALPSVPFTYLTIKIDGTNYKIPVYNT